MSAVDFELLYHDDDDDGDERENENNDGDEAHVGARRNDLCGSCVVAKRYLNRWVSRSSGRAFLRKQSGAVITLSSHALCRRSFSAMCRSFTERLQMLRDGYRDHLHTSNAHQGDLSDVQSRRAEIEDSADSLGLQREDHRRLADELSLSLADSRARAEAQSGVLRDLDSSLGAVAGERVALVDRIGAARQYIAHMQQKREQYINPATVQREPPEPSELQHRLACLTAAVAANASANRNCGSFAGDDDCDYSTSLTAYSGPEDSSDTAGESLSFRTYLFRFKCNLLLFIAQTSACCSCRTWKLCIGRRSSPRSAW